jgi:hypothetical protein
MAPGKRMYEILDEVLKNPDIVDAMIKAQFAVEYITLSGYAHAVLANATASKNGPLSEEVATNK